MTSNDIVKDARIAHVRELKAEVARLKAELAAAQQACATWEHHFALALAAARDVDRLPSGGAMLILDGWNIVFNSKFKGEGDAPLGKQRLIDAARAYAPQHPNEFVGLVFDGADANAACDGNFRVSYTGGEGEQRADSLVVNYLRLLRLEGRTLSVTVVTNDKTFGRKAAELGATVRPVKEFADGT